MDPIVAEILAGVLGIIVGGTLGSLSLIALIKWQNRRDEKWRESYWEAEEAYRKSLREEKE